MTHVKRPFIDILNIPLSACDLTFTGCNQNDGWQGFNKYCYKLTQDLKTWNNAMTDCVAIGSNLVTIHSEEEQDFVWSIIPVNVDIWMGGNDIATEGDWVWEDGKPWGVYTKWHPGEPNDANYAEDCLTMYQAHGMWNDLDCDWQLSSICKKGDFQLLFRLENIFIGWFLIAV